ncbi:MAG TPA: DUF4956 domain-containing protein [Bacteroidales bacterium]|jgi:hypothetical protein|nr:DUF4956 domain-containing protein [Bacteroidales bacterium]
MNLMESLVPDNVNVAGISLLDLPNFLEFVLRFILNMSVIMILVRWLYYSKTRRKDYLFTYILISSIVFLLCFLLESVKLQIGFALGMFAIFGIIRYRTDALPIKEMTYLFLIIGVSVINALTNAETSLLDLLFTNAVIIFITYGLEKVWLLKHESSKLIVYEKINLIKKENYDLLIKDLQERTGIKKINRVEVGKINFLRDICDLTIYYYADNEENIPGKPVNNENDDDDD